MKIVHLIIIFVLPFSLIAQVNITSPISRQIIQRDNSNNATLQIAGQFSNVVDRIEARAVAIQGGNTTGWQTVQNNPAGGVFWGSITISGGWYNLEVRGTLFGSQVGGVSTVTPIGAGEVFVIAGQSNARGISGTALPNSTDDRVNSINFSAANAPLTSDPPYPSFQRINSGSFGVNGDSQWFWGKLGDMLANQWNVPILFINTAYDATSSQNWIESANGTPTANIYCMTCGPGGTPLFYPGLLPYSNMKAALNNYVSMLGVRAVLWQQGEADTQLGVSQSTYFNNLTGVIQKTRSHSGKNISWVVAQSSYNFFSTSSNVLNAQAQVAGSYPNTFAGPSTDNATRSDGTHFDGNGLNQAANLWFNSLTTGNFLSSSQPQASSAIIPLTSNCNSGTNISFTMNGGLGNYNWTDLSNNSGNGSQNVSVNSGQNFRGSARDGNGNIFFSPVVTTPANTIPAAPTISTVGATAFCAGGSVNLTSSYPIQNTWNSGSTSQTIAANVAGNYSVSYKGIYGCQSPTSSPTSVTVNALPATPTISAGGPTTFCDGGNVGLSSTNAQGYLWNNGATTASISANTNGNFSVKAIDNNGCQSATSNTLSVVVNPNPPMPVITPSGPTAFCVGSSVSLSSNGGPQYFWSNGATTSSILVGNSGTFTVYTKDANGCQSPTTSSISVIASPIPAVPNISASGPTTFCAGGNVSLTTDATTGLLWSNSSTATSLSINSSGTFSVRGVNPGCISVASNPITVTVNPLPAAPSLSISGPTTFCAGGNVMLQSSPASVYVWNNNTTASSYIATTSGTFAVAIKDANGCQSPNSQSVNVVVNPLPAKPIINTSRNPTLCQGESVTLTVTAPAALPASYLWNNGNTSSSITTSIAGRFGVRVTDANGCRSVASADTLAVIVNPVPARPTITNTEPLTFCADKKVTLTAPQDNSYLWNNGATTRSIDVNSSGTFSVIVANQFNCNSLVSSIVTTTAIPLPPAPVITAQGSLDFCEGSSVKLCSNNTTLPNTWSITNSTTNCTDASLSGDYFARVTEANGCQSAPSNIIKIQTLARPSTPQVVQIGTYLLEAQGAILGDIYEWKNATTQTLFNNTSNILKVVQSGNYTVRTRKNYTTPSGNISCYSNDAATLAVTLDPSNVLSVYPNPNTTGGLAYIETLADWNNAQIELHNFEGKLIYSDTVPVFNQRYLLDFRLRRGTYILTFRADNFIQRKRLLVY